MVFSNAPVPLFCFPLFCFSKSLHVGRGHGNIASLSNLGTGTGRHDMSPTVDILVLENFSHMLKPTNTESGASKQRFVCPASHLERAAHGSSKVSAF